MVDPTVAALRMRPTGVARRGPLLANPLNLFAIVLIALFALGAVLAAVIAPYDPIVQALGSRLDPPSAAHWLGTDQLGQIGRASCRERGGGYVGAVRVR